MTISKLDLALLKALTDHPHLTTFIMESAGTVTTRANVYGHLCGLARRGLARRHDRKTITGTKRHPKWSITDKGREARQ